MLVAFLDYGQTTRGSETLDLFFDGSFVGENYRGYVHKIVFFGLRYNRC